MKNSKFSVFLLFLTLGFLVAAAWKAFSFHSAITGLESALEAKRKDVKELKEQMDEAAKKSKENLQTLTSLRDRKKDDAESAEKDLEGISLQVEGQREALKIKEGKIEQLAMDLQEAKKSIAAVQKEVEHAQNRLTQFSSTLPVMEDKVSGLQAAIEGERQREAEGERTLTTYESITKVYKQHFSLTLMELQNYLYSRPWLERGEKVSVSNVVFDLQAGFLGFPAGRDRGIEKGMTFTVRADGRNICRIKVNQVSTKNSVAMIIPLYGKPLDLRKYKSFDLIYL